MPAAIPRSDETTNPTRATDLHAVLTDYSGGDRGDEQPGPCPECTANQTERHRFDEELKEHIAPARADRLSQPDLPRSLSNAHEHDVGDTKTAYCQGDSGKQEGHQVEAADYTAIDSRGRIGCRDKEGILLTGQQLSLLAHDQPQFVEGRPGDGEASFLAVDGHRLVRAKASQQVGKGMTMNRSCDRPKSAPRRATVPIT